MNKEAVLALIHEHDAKFIDIRFTDTRGKEQHMTLPVSAVDNGFYEDGKAFDGSSIKGWREINDSDLLLIPDWNTLVLDPFYQDTTLIVRCTAVDPATKSGYERCPRSLALRAEKYLQASGIADFAFFGPEPEFFIFDDVRWETRINSASYTIESDEAQWNSSKGFDGGNIGHRPRIKGGYFPVPPVDSLQDIRSAICLTLEGLGITTETHHHEVGTAGQCEVAMRFASLVEKADQMQLFKYVVHNVAHNYGKTATFMPKPLVGDNGNGMHCHMSLMKDNVNLFSGKGYAGLSDTALHFMGGIIHHARALNAFTNPATNSYKRLVPGFEAPVLLAYSACNRSAAIRIPYVSSPKARRIEVRFPDAMANPYLAFSAMLMAGMDGIEHKMDPGKPIDKDLYALSVEELQDVPTVCNSLEQAVSYLKKDQGFLLKGGVFTEDLINSYIALREEEILQVNTLVHPMEFELYYSL